MVSSLLRIPSASPRREKEEGAETVEPRSSGTLVARHDRLKKTRQSLRLGSLQPDPAGRAHHQEKKGKEKGGKGALRLLFRLSPATALARPARRGGETKEKKKKGRGVCGYELHVVFRARLDAVAHKEGKEEKERPVTLSCPSCRCARRRGGEEKGKGGAGHVGFPCWSRILVFAQKRGISISSPSSHSKEVSPCGKKEKRGLEHVVPFLLVLLYFFTFP